MKLTEKKFIEAGYTKWDQSCLNNCDYLLQKKVKDTNGIRYFVNIYVYVWKNAPWYREGIDKEVGFQPEVQFDSLKYDAMNVTLLVDDMTDIQEIEDTFENLWESVGKPYYENYEG